jgi:hypothetical protein
VSCPCQQKWFVIFSVVAHTECRLNPVEKCIKYPHLIQAFRYTYYKKVGGAKSFLEGLRSVIDDKGTRWPESTNAFRHYSLTPEVIQNFKTSIISFGLRHENYQNT